MMVKMTPQQAIDYQQKVTKSLMDEVNFLRQRIDELENKNEIEQEAKNSKFINTDNKNLG